MRKKIHIELLRIIAALFVIFNHTGGMGFEAYALYPTGGIGYFIMLFCSVLCKVAVPIYLMISGALLLNKDRSLKEIWLVRIPRIFVILLITSLVYYIAYIKDNSLSFSLLTYFKGLYNNGFSGHLWYLYAYMAFLMCLPFLRAIAKNMTKEHFGYLILLYFLFSLIPVAEAKLLPTTMAQHINPSWLWSDIVIFPLFGYFLEHTNFLRNLKLRYQICIIVAGIAALLPALLLTHDSYSTLGQPTQSYHSLFVLLPSISLYTLARILCEKLNFSSWAEKGITIVGSCTFGVYLLHLVIPLRVELISLLCDIAQLPLPFAASGYCIIIFLYCAIVTFFIKKIPYIGSLL